MATYARQRLTRRVGEAAGPLFIGMNTLRERELVRQFEAIQARGTLQLDERYRTDFFRRAHVPLSALLRETRIVWGEVGAHLDLSRPSEGLNKIYLLTFFLMHGHGFIYLRAWLRRYLSQPSASCTIACTSASYAAFAPAAVGAETMHMEHGFQRHSLVYPDFARSICFNGFDAEHIQRRLPRCVVTVAAQPAKQLPTRRVVAIAGIYGESDGFGLIRPFIDWASRNDLPVFVRKHPADTSDYWEQWRGISGIEMCDGRGSFLEFLERFRPRMLASWFSTALYDALLNGVVPITVTPEGHEAALDTVFPFRELFLCWPEHKEVAQNLLDDDRHRAEFLADSRARAMSVHCHANP
jgi:hypothetical protein